MVFLVVILTGFAPKRNLHSLAVVNYTEDTIWITITPWNGTTFKGLRWEKVAPSDSCVILRHYYGSTISWYAHADNSDRTDFQTSGGNLMTPPQNFHEVRISPEKNGVNAREWRHYNRIDFAPDDTLFVLRFTERSNCRGVCSTGRGVRYNYRESFDVTWRDSVPDGQGILQSMDTIYKGLWSMGVWNGEFEISSADGYFESGEYQYGFREGKFHIRKPDGDRYEIIYQKGVRRHQVMWIAGVRYENFFDENGDEITIDPPNKPTRKRKGRTKVFNLKQ